MASLLTPVTDSIVTMITGTVMPAVLSVLGGFLTFIVAVYGVLMVLAHFKGQGSAYVHTKIAYWFASEIAERDYSDYAASRRRKERNHAFDERYRSENGSRSGGKSTDFFNNV